MADFCPVFLAFPQMAKGNSQMGRENSEDRRHKNRLSFLHIDHFVTKKIEGRLQFFAMSRGGVLEGIDIDWDDSWLLGTTRRPIFIVSF